MTTARRTPRSSRSAVRLPPGWRRMDADELPDVPGLEVAAEARGEPGSGVRPRLVLSRPPVLPEVDEADLEDDDAFVDDAGREVVYRRWSAPDRREILHESWAWTDPDTPTLLVATLAREDYLDLTDLLEAVAETVDPDAPATMPQGA